MVDDEIEFTKIWPVVNLKCQEKIFIHKRLKKISIFGRKNINYISYFIFLIYSLESSIKKINTSAYMSSVLQVSFLSIPNMFHFYF